MGRSLTDRPVEDQKIDPETIPDKITLVDPETLPNFYSLGITMMLIAPFLVVAIIYLLSYPIYRAARAGIKTLKQVLALQGAVIFSFGLLAVAIGPLIKPPILASLTSPNIRVVVDNIIDAFVGAFNGVAVSIIMVPAIILLLAALCLQLWPFINQKITGYTAARRTNSSKRTA